MITALDTGLRAGEVLGEGFYARDTVIVARELLGQYLVVTGPEGVCGGRVVETEAYLGAGDPACHSSRGKTERNAVMFGPAGQAYIYQIYGIYLCFNVTTDAPQVPAAVLIRAVQPEIGVELMQARCPARSLRDLCRGPARLVQALGIRKEFNGTSVMHGPIRFVAGEKIKPEDIVAAGRIGISQAADAPLRFYLAVSQYVSKRAKI